jgi:multidrug efflux pump subunit AcrA (membrane-fusion protein)
MNKKSLVIGVVLLIVFASAFIFKNYFSNQEVITPKISSIVDSVYGLGSIKSRKIFHARVALTTLMEKMYVDEGQFVKKGTALFRLSEGSTVYAPFDGDITHISVEDGEMVFAQKDILIMQDLKDLFVEVNLEQEGAIKIKKNMKAVLSFDNLSQQIIEGQVFAVLPHEEKFKVQVLSNQFPEGLLPAMSVDVTFTISSKDSAILVPVKAVVNGHIMRIRQGTKERIKVITGIQDGSFVEIVDPILETTDQIQIPKSKI